MRMTVYAGWLNLIVGAVIGIGAIAVGHAGFGAIMLVALGGSGVFMIWLASGWDKPLDNADQLYKFGRPANATVLKVGDEQLQPDGVRLAKVTLQVAPVNESRFKTTRTLALPRGRTPVVGEQVTVKFDPQSRKNVVLLDENFKVEDHVTAAFSFASGVQGVGLWNYDSFQSTDHVEVIGTEGALSFSCFAGEPLRLTTARGVELINAPYPEIVQLPLIQTVVDALTGRGESPSDGHTAVRTAQVIDTLLSDYRQSHRITYDSADPQ